MTLTLSLLAGLAIAWVLVATVDRYGSASMPPRPCSTCPSSWPTASRTPHADRTRCHAAGHLRHRPPVAAGAGADAVAAAGRHAALLDEASARSPWLEPWRALARTIAFNAKHVFVSRRLVRVLKGRGRLAVYFPDDPAPDAKALRLYRAVARIAMQAEAAIVPIFVDGARHLPFSLTPAGQAPRRLFPRLSINVLKPMTIAEMTAAAADPAAHSRNVLFDRITEARSPA